MIRSPNPGEAGDRIVSYESLKKNYFNKTIFLVSEKSLLMNR